MLADAGVTVLLSIRTFLVLLPFRIASPAVRLLRIGSYSSPAPDAEAIPRLVRGVRLSLVRVLGAAKPTFLVAGLISLLSDFHLIACMCIAS